MIVCDFQIVPYQKVEHPHIGIQLSGKRRQPPIAIESAWHTGDAPVPGDTLIR